MRPKEREIAIDRVEMAASDLCKALGFKIDGSAPSHMKAWNAFEDAVREAIPLTNSLASTASKERE